jgi:DNA (cytosine-5)-methyltransferase 1
MIRLRCSGVRVSVTESRLASRRPLPSQRPTRVSGVPQPPETSRRPVAIDLFCGAGGLSVGLELAGFDVVAGSDYDPVHAATHEYNFPLTPMLCGDVSQIAAESLLAAAERGVEAHGATDWDGRIDLIAGGPPCQGFSFMGKRLVDDERNRLVFHFYRLIAELRPRYFVMENVPGMASGGHAGVLEQLIENFEAIGYRFAPGHWAILNAADFGVPQDRRRLFLIGTDAGQKIATPPTPIVRRVARDGVGSPEPGDLSLGATVWDALGDIPNLTRYPSLQKSDSVRLSREAFEEQEAMASKYGLRLRARLSEPDDLAPERNWDRELLTASARTAHTDESIRRFRQTKPGEVEPISRFYRLPAAGLCNTLRAGTGSERGAFTSPRPIHPTHPRVLSNREAARLHSLPDWFRPHATKWHGFRQIGNAVAPLVGKAAAGAVVEALGLSPSKPTVAVEPGDPTLLTLTMKQATQHYDADLSQIPARRRRIRHPALAA